MYICICKAVTDSQIKAAIENGACTRKQLAQCFDIGRDCGKCNKDVNVLLKQAIMPGKTQIRQLVPPFYTA